jgi:hypothetical protein
MRERRSYISLTVFVAATLLLSACNKTSSSQEAASSEVQPAPPMGAAPVRTAGMRSGTVEETLDSGGYTYVLINTGSESIWAAGPQTGIEEGQTVTIPAGMAMNNYHSSTLDRDFDVVYFVEAIYNGDVTASSGGAMSALPPGHPQPPMPGRTGTSTPSASGATLPPGHPQPEQIAAGEFDYSGIVKAPGGVSVAEVFERTDELNGQEIVLRGKVVKYNSGILGSNWLHVRDGSGAAGTNDLTVTTNATAKEGDTVLIRGTLGKDRDIGSGYFFPVIVEDAQVTVE